MAMNGNNLGSALWTAVKGTQSFSPALTPAEDAAGLALWQAIGTALVTYIDANAVVTITSATATGVTSGTSTAPVTGTGSVS
jgi:uncharacterized membrane protein YeiH